MPTLVFLTGFEHGITYASGALGSADLRVWNAITGSPTIGSTYRRGSTGLGLQINPSSASEYVRIAHPASRRRLVGTFQFQRKSGTSYRVAVLVASSGGQVMLGVDSSGYITLQLTGGNLVTSSVQATVDTWIRIDFDADFNSAGGSLYCDWKINGTTQSQANVSAGGQDMTYSQFGNDSSATHETWYDDWALSVTAGDYPIGDIYIKGYWPNADGTHSPSDPSSYFRDAAGTGINGTSNPAWDNLTQLAAVSTRTEQYARTDSTHKLQVAFADSSESSAPLGVQAIAGLSAAGTQADNITVRVNDNGTTTNIFSGDPSITTDGLNTQFLCQAVRAGGQGSWTTSAFNGLLSEGGLSSDVSPVPYWYGAILEAAFVTSGSVPVTVSLAVTVGAALARMTGHGTLAPVSLTASIARRTAHQVSAAVTVGAALARQTVHDISAVVTLGLTTTSTKVKVWAINVATTVSATLTRETRHIVGAALTAAIALTRQLGKSLAVSLSIAPALIRQLGKSLAVGASIAATLIRQNAKQVVTGLTVALTTTGTKVKVITIAIAATIGASLSRMTGKAVSAATTIGATLSRMTGRVVSAATTLTAALTKQASKAVAAATTIGASVSRVTSKILTAATTLTAALTKQASKILTAAVSAVVTSARAVLKSITATVTNVVSVVREKIQGGGQLFYKTIDLAVRFVRQRVG